MPWLRVFVLAVATALGCGAASGEALAQAVLQDAPLRIFDGTQLTRDNYTVVGRLWAESWQSAFFIPGHADSSAAIAALSQAAVRAGGDALINVSCLDNSESWFYPGYYCYGLAIKLR